MYNPSSLEEWDSYSTIDGQNSGINFKNSKGKIGGWYLYNNASSVRYVKLYDLNTPPDPSINIPKLVFALPANGGSNIFAGSGIAFYYGIGIRVCTGIANDDDSSPSSNDVIVNIFYK